MNEVSKMGGNKLGILGGMGPFATSVFLERIVTNTMAKNDQEHIDTIIINHASLPDRTNVILNNNHDKFLTAIKPDIELLEYSNVNNIAVPCNTSHFFYDEMQSMTKVNIINMVELTVKHVHSNYGVNSKVAVLATKGTTKSEIYKNELDKCNLQHHSISPETQDEIMDIIYKVKFENLFDSDKLNEIIRKLVVQEDCACVILACTELSCIQIDSSLRAKYVDALDILVNQSIILSNRNVKNTHLNL